jgi:hypothetical protein
MNVLTLKSAVLKSNPCPRLQQTLLCTIWTLDVALLTFQDNWTWWETLSLVDLTFTFLPSIFLALEVVSHVSGPGFGIAGIWRHTMTHWDFDGRPCWLCAEVGTLHRGGWELCVGPPFCLALSSLLKRKRSRYLWLVNVRVSGLCTSGEPLILIWN